MVGEGDLMQHSPNSLRLARALAPALAALSLPALFSLVGCDGDALNLGNDDAVDSEEESTCAFVSGNVFATTQADIDALEGCRELPGPVYVRIPPGSPGFISFEPLAALEVIHGQLWIDGPATSLAGLESLREVDNLRLSGLQVPDLTALRSLTRVEGDSQAVREHGLIFIDKCDQLTDLRGLEHITSWRNLNISENAGLVSLAGLQAPSQIEGVFVMGSPQLTDLSALAPVVQANSFSVSATGVKGFEGFRLDRAEYLSLDQNHALTDLDGLISLSTVGILEINDNDALERIDLFELSNLDALSVTGNAVLKTVPRYDEREAEGIYTADELPDTASRRPTRALFEVGGNPEVTSIALSAVFGSFEQVAIYRNASVTQLDLGSLARAGTLWIQDNPVLGSVGMPMLDRVDDLTIVNNPALSIAPFAAVHTFTTTASGNLDPLTP
jgi:hypothetical protein